MSFVDDLKETAALILELQAAQARGELELIERDGKRVWRFADGREVDVTPEIQVFQVPRILHKGELPGEGR